MVKGKYFGNANQLRSNSDVFKGIKILFFFALTATVIYLYAIDIYTKFQNNATTFTRKTEKADNFLMPPLVICMENGLKPSVMKKYKLKTIYDFAHEYAMNQEISSVWDTFVEASYIVNRDFHLTVRQAYSLKHEPTLLKAGDNNWNQGNDDSYQIILNEYYTFYAGTCYQIQSNISISPPSMIHIELRFDESLNEADFPPVCLIYQKNIS